MTRQTRIKNTLAGCMRATQLVKELSEISRLSALKAICGTTLIILDTVQTVRKLKEDYEELAIRIAEFVAAVSLEVSRGKVISYDQLDRLDNLLSALREIQTHMLRQAKLGWVRRLTKLQELKDQLEYHKAKFEDARQLFNVTSLIAIRQLLASNIPCTISNLDKSIQRMGVQVDSVVSVLNETRTECNLGFKEITTRLDMISATYRSPEFATFRYDQIRLVRQIHQLPSAYLHHGEIEGKTSGAKVLVKVYHSDNNKFKRDIEIWRRIRHPNLHYIVGISAMESSAPFVLFSSYASNDVHSYLQRRHRENEVDSFMATLKIMQGIAAGLEFLRHQCSLSKNELEECAKDSNFVLNNEGQIVIGHNLVAREPHYLTSRSSENLDEFLKSVLYDLTVSFTYLRSEDYSDWSWVTACTNGRCNSHLRMLENFTCYYIPSFTVVSNELSRLIEVLEGRHALHELTFPDIRQAALSLRAGAFVYRPTVPLDACIGDIGYMRDGKFTVLENIRHLVNFEMEPGRSLTLSSTGGHEEGKPDDTGLLRHKLRGALCATSRRFTSSEIVGNLRDAWDFLISNAATLLAPYLEHGLELEIRDLFLVVGVQQDLRYTYFERKVDDEDTFPVPNVEFVEYENPAPQQPWGYWVVEDGQGVEITRRRFPQNILFVQLENFDVPEEEVLNAVAVQRILPRHI